MPADGTLTLAEALVIERAAFHAHLLGLNEQDTERFISATQDYHAGRIDTNALIKAMEKTDGQAA